MTQPPKKPHWTERAKKGVSKTLEFLETYAPALLATSMRVVGFGTIIAGAAVSVGSPYMDPHAAGYLGALALQFKRIWEILKDMKEFLKDDDIQDLDLQKHIENNEAQIFELSQMIGEMTEINTDLVNSNAALSESLEAVLKSNGNLQSSNGQLQRALRQHYSCELETAEKKGLIKRQDFDFEKEGTIVKIEMDDEPVTEECCSEGEEDDHYPRQ